MKKKKVQFTFITAKRMSDRKRYCVRWLSSDGTHGTLYTSTLVFELKSIRSRAEQSIVGIANTEKIFGVLNHA